MVSDWTSGIRRQGGLWRDELAVLPANVEVLELE
jgi:hypothetical protein